MFLRFPLVLTGLVLTLLAGCSTTKSPISANKVPNNNSSNNSGSGSSENSSSNQGSITPTQASSINFTGERMIFSNSQYKDGLLSVVVPNVKANEKVAVIPFYSQAAPNTGVSFELLVSGTTGTTSVAAQAAEVTPEAEPMLQKATVLTPPRASDTTTRDFVYADNNKKYLIKANIMAETEHALFYVDNGYDIDPTPFADNFEKMYPMVRENFGKESDVDKNGKVIVLISYNIVGGMVSLSDLFKNSVAGSNNWGDVMYLCGDCFSQKFVAHEFTHLVHNNEKFLRYFVGEESWIEEGLATVAGELAGDKNRKFTETFLSSPRTVSTFLDYSMNNYGAFYFMMRYAGEQARTSATEAVWKKFIQNPKKGKTLIAEVVQRDFETFFADWATTLMFDHTGLLKDEVAKFNFQDINLRDRIGQDNTPETFAPLRYETISNQKINRTMQNLAFFNTTSGKGEDVTIQIKNTGAYLPSVVIVKYEGQLPY